VVGEEAGRRHCGLAPRSGRLYSEYLVSGRTRDTAGLSAAATALEAELRRYDELAAELRSGRLVSEKDLRRAAQALQALRASDARLGELVQGLVAAIGMARDRQQAEAEAVQARADEVRKRSETLAVLLARWEALGVGAAEVNRLMQQSGGPDDANGGERRATLGPNFDEVDERLGRLADDARDLVQAAETEEFADLARRAESLRAQLLSARNKLRTLDEKR